MFNALPLAAALLLIYPYSCSVIDLESLDLCGYLGATCQSECVGDTKQLVHRWAIPLCSGSQKCCTQPPATYSASVNSPQQNNCQLNGGSCQPWYNGCTNGSTQSHECDNSWQVCCMESAPADRQPSEPAGASPTDDESNSVPEAAPPTTSSPGQCGRSQVSSRQKRIVGGAVSPRGMWPWHAGIKSALGGVFCSGTIVSSKYILTAAHCFKRVRNLSLYRITTGLTAGPNQPSHAIRRIIKHHLYDEHTHVDGQATHSHKYDIALVELEDEIEFDRDAQPACLPARDDKFQSKRCWLTGWGATNSDGSNGDGNADDSEYTLRHVGGTVLMDDECKRLWGSMVNGKMVCFGNDQHGACKGDSGGGMFCERDDGAYTIAGVISWGSARCNTKATVLTDITQYTDWISERLSDSSSPAPGATS